MSETPGSQHNSWLLEYEKNWRGKSLEKFRTVVGKIANKNLKKKSNKDLKLEKKKKSQKKNDREI